MSVPKSMNSVSKNPAIDTYSDRASKKAKYGLLAFGRPYFFPPEDTAAMRKARECAEAVIIILAGGASGVTQPETWLKLMESAPDNKLALMVHVDPSGRNTVPDSMRKWVSAVQRIGTWGGYSLVQLESELYVSVLKKYPGAKHFYLVS